MLNEKDIDDAAQQLAEFRQTNTLSSILESYTELIASYKRLKSDYEEEREGRERYKQMARGQERNPFVLVLIDGDGYVFSEDQVTAGAEGGTRAAQQLNDTIKTSLRRKGLESCDIMVRVYANLVGLSKTLSKAGLCGPEKRSLAPFTSSFTRSYGLTDFVDAGELKENADFKLRAMLRLYAENAQCKHIYFAACHDVGYVSELTPYRGCRDRFTLVRTPGLLFHEEFAKLSLDIEELPGVFRAAKFDGPPAYPRPISTHQTVPAAQSESQKVCSFFAIGKCRYGKTCKNLHAGTKTMTPRSTMESPFSSHHLSRTTRSDDESTNGFGRLSFNPPTHYGTKNGMTDTSLLKIDPASQLPKKENIPTSYVAINESQQRLDPYIPPPSPTASSLLKDRSVGRKICNNKQLTDSCPNEKCEYDHDPLPEELKPALEWLARSLPCPRREKCRNASCVQGHICQNPDCKHRGGRAFCRLFYTMHQTDLTFDRCVPGMTHRPTSLHQPSEVHQSSEFHQPFAPPSEFHQPFAASESMSGEEEEILTFGVNV
ncbi:Uu.00g065450.m01.CDS01 [Anthostomella pinea]|uniref:Uu.00g065450.m01.CDS01 n=1 Tax=Anthostomella pinea TaxID=933095 RepID=A0AAI8VUK1_9PEZI|nr:Uu.00g065450.m01.CDS01 [Anthostomella pinea]